MKNKTNWLTRFLEIVHFFFAPQTQEQKSNENIVQSKNIPHYENREKRKVTNNLLPESTGIKEDIENKSGLGDFKPDDLQDKDVAQAYQVLEEIKKTLKQQEANKDKKRKKYEKKKKERMAVTKERAADLQKYFEQLQSKPRHHMLCFIMYDIENDRIRTKVAKYLEEKGLKRVQKSVFFGELDKRIYKQMHEVLIEIQAAYENTDSIVLVPISEDEAKSMKLIGKDIDFSYAIIRQNTLFF